MGGWKRASSSAFQFTPLREGRPRVVRRRGRRRYFNSRPSARGDRPAWRTCRNSNDFNSRPSARGDCPRRGGIRRGKLFQFTPLREGRHACEFFRQERWRISIHAPPRGATPPDSHLRRVEDFNSRPSARGDARRWRTFPQSARFQFTPLREGRQGTRYAVHGANERFQFTPLREGRHGKARTGRHRTHFNSRPSARGDASSRRLRWARACISIHAPPRGATIAAATGYIGQGISIHAPPRGATRLPRDSLRQRDGISIHAPPRGATHPSVRRRGRTKFQFTPLREGRRGNGDGTHCPTLFQFTPLREGRRSRYCVPPPRIYFNSRPSARGDAVLFGTMIGLSVFQFTPLREGRRR